MNFRNVLIINPFGIGDVLFTTPLIDALKMVMPQDGRITFICNEKTYPILAANKNVDEVIIYEKDFFRDLWKGSKIRFFRESAGFIRNISKKRFDAVFDITLGRQFSFLFKLLRVPVRAGFDYRGRGFFLTDKIKIDGFHDKPIPEYYLELAGLFGIKSARKELNYDVPVKDNDEAGAFLRTNGLSAKEFFGIIPGGGDSWGTDAVLKRWSSENFAEVADNIAREYGLVPVIFGNNKETELCRSVLNKMKNKAVLSTGLSLGGFTAVLKRCKIAICNDGGPLHLAVSQGIKTVSIFGPVDDNVYGPWPKTSNHIVVKKEIDCRPCYRWFKYRHCGHRSCLTKIEPIEVLNAARTLLKQ